MQWDVRGTYFSTPYFRTRTKLQHSSAHHHTVAWACMDGTGLPVSGNRCSTRKLPVGCLTCQMKTGSLINWFRLDPRQVSMCTVSCLNLGSKWARVSLQ